MAETDKQKLHIFFSWQSDSPQQTNTAAIRTALKTASQDIERKYADIKIILDEATRDTPGSPNIFDKIIEKINASQIFIADITTITQDCSPKPSANPNVLIELGYAISQVGWDRIILLFNESFGIFPGDIPFDIIQRRVSKYSFPQEENENSPLHHKNKLYKLLKLAIKTIIEKNPQTPNQLQGLTHERIMRERDIENINWLLSQMHIQTIENHIESLPCHIESDIFWFWEGFNGIVTSNLFYIYDDTLKTAIGRIHSSWDITLSFGEFYHTTASGRSAFTRRLDGPSPIEENALDKLTEAAKELRRELQIFVEYIRKNYLEIDISRMSDDSWGKYAEFQRQMQHSVTKMVDE